MTIWSRIKNIYYAALLSPYTGGGYGDLYRSMFGGSTFASKGETTLASNETVFAAVSRLSNAMGTLPLKLYKDFKPVQTNSSDLLSSAPNSNMTSFDFIRTLESLRNTTGNSYAIKIYGLNYQIESLQILDPKRVEPVFDEKTMELWYEIQGTEHSYYVHNADILHFKHIHGFGLKGISPIDVLENTMAFDAEVKKFALDQMNGSKTSFILKYAANVSEDKKRKVIENFLAFYRDNGGILFQEPGVEMTPIENKFISSEIFEVEKITRSRVATVFNIPVHMLGESQGSSYSSMEQLNLEFAQGTLLPIITQYEQQFNIKMLTKAQRLQGYKYKFNLKALLRADTATQMEAYFKGIRSGIYKPDEVRAWEELPPEEGGNTLLISGDLYPLGMSPSERNPVAPKTIPKGGE